MISWDVHTSQSPELTQNDDWVGNVNESFFPATTNNKFAGLPNKVDVECLKLYIYREIDH